jgi:predicted HNH restriction endonuclease
LAQLSHKWLGYKWQSRNIAEDQANAYQNSVRYLNNNNKIVQDFVMAAQNLGKTWVNEGNQTIRSVISGAMKHFGTMPGAGDHSEFCFAPTMHNKNGANFFIKRRIYQPS